MQQPRCTSEWRIVGAILAGGRSSRFGSNKALAPVGGKRLIDHVAAGLGAQVPDLVLCGGAPLLDGVPCVADRPAPDMGPLGGLNAALHYAETAGFDAVVTIGCDMPVFPADLVAQLLAAGAPVAAQDMPLVGLWPSRLAATLDDHLAQSSDRSMRGWGALSAARTVRLSGRFANVNRPEDLQNFTDFRGFSA